MNYKDIKTLLESYSYYFSIMYGINFKLKRDKKYNEFLFLVKNCNNNKDDFVYLPILAFEIGDLKNKCIVRLHGLSNFENIYDFIFKLEDEWKDRNVINIQYEQAVKYHDIKLLNVTIEAYNEEDIKTIFKKLDNINYFSRWV